MASLVLGLLLACLATLVSGQLWMAFPVDNDLIGDQKNPNLIMPKFSTTFRSLTTEGFQCQSPCIMRHAVYQCHHELEGWRYCSPQENYAFNGRPCKETSPCKFYTDHYASCLTIDGGHAKLQCGLKDDQDGPILTGAFNSFCIDECSGRGYKYSWCHSTHPQGWDYCSTETGMTSTLGVRCNRGSLCSFGPRAFKTCEVGRNLHDRLWHCGEAGGDVFKKVNDRIATPVLVKPFVGPTANFTVPAPPLIQWPQSNVTHPVKPIIRWTQQLVQGVQPSGVRDFYTVWTWIKNIDGDK